MVHLVESVHRRGDLDALNLLVVCVDKAVATRAIVTGNYEGVEMRLQTVCLSPKQQTPGHAELEREKEGRMDRRMEGDMERDGKRDGEK